MTSSLDVAIIGGGVIGTSILYHLTERNIRNVSLFEKGQLGSGATSKAAGGVRNVFSHPINIKMGTQGLEFYRRFSKATGSDLECEETGYLYLYHDGESHRKWAGYCSELRKYGVATRLLDPNSARELFSSSCGDTITGGFYAPNCLHTDPYSVTQGFATAAQDQGATIHTKTSVESIHTNDNNIAKIATADETFEPDYVVNAAGPWGPELAKAVGLDLPIDLSARRIAVTEPLVDTPSPLVIDRDRRFYFRFEKNGSMLLCDLDGDVKDFTDPGKIQRNSPGFDYYLDAFSKVNSLIPAVEDADIINGWAGIQTNTPDGHPILGSTSINGFLLACGFNGLGVMLAPTVGAAIADLIVDGATDIVDIDQLSLDRFNSPPEHRIEPEELA